MKVAGNRQWRGKIFTILKTKNQINHINQPNNPTGLKMRANYTPSIPCTNPNYGNPNHYPYSLHWTKNHHLDETIKVEAFYPINEVKSFEPPIKSDDDVIYPDLGRVDTKKMLPENKIRFDYLISAFGADNVVSVVMGKQAEALGYKPVEEAEKEIYDIIKEKKVLDDFKKDPELALQTYSAYTVENQDNVDEFVNELKNSSGKEANRPQLAKPTPIGLG